MDVIASGGASAERPAEETRNDYVGFSYTVQYFTITILQAYKIKYASLQ